jgi:AraC-like DNA-binding protein
MDSHLAMPITTLDLCIHLCVSRRTLFYSFREALQMSPMAYLKCKRLHAVRRDLKSIDRGDWSIREVASRYRFRHSGQFTADHQRLFEERPSDTVSGQEDASKRAVGQGDEVRLELDGGKSLDAYVLKRGIRPGGVEGPGHAASDGIYTLS